MRRFFARFFIFILLAIAWFSCQEDDICIDRVTPRFSLFFLNSTTNTSIALDTLVICRLNQENQCIESETALFLNDTMAFVSFDMSQSRSRYLIKRSVAEGSPSDLLELSYQKTEEFNSKACGFKLNFSNIQVDSFVGNIADSVKIINTELTNEQDTILYIYFNN